MIKFPPFEPDRSIYAMNATTSLVNCIPIADGWGPKAALVPFTDALAGTCVGMVFARTMAGGFRLVAGTATALYELNLTDYSWDDISGPSAPYAVPAEDRWQFVQYGQTLIAINITDDPQEMDIDSGLAFADLANAPKAKYGAVIGEHLVLAHLASDKNGVMFSGRGDAEYWTIGQKGCDFQSFPDGEIVQGILGSERGGLIFHRTLIRQAALTISGDYSFTTSIVNPARGVASPLSLCQTGPGQFFYYSDDGFFLGAEGKPIGGERVDRWFFSQIDQAKVYEIRSVADPFEKIVWTQATKPDESKFILGYDWQLDRWCYAAGNTGEMATMVTPGTSWDGLDSLYASIDEVTSPYDSPVFSGGLKRFAAFNSNNILGFFSGLPIAATLDTPDIELNPGYRTMVDAARVYTDSTNFTLKAITSDIHGASKTAGLAKSPNARSGLCHMRSDARIHVFRMEIPADTSWSFVTGLDLDGAQRTGKV